MTSRGRARGPRGLLTLLLILATAAGAAPPTPPPSPAARARADSAVRVRDDAGAEITLPHPARRIVALSPGITELLFELGAGPSVVAGSEFSDTPAAARALPRVARAQGIDVEAIAALHPDLVVTWGSGYPPAQLDALRRLGVPVYVHEPRTLEAVAGAAERLGALSGAARAPALAAAYRERLEALRRRYAGRRSVAVFYQVWASPLMTLSGRHMTGEALRSCGARNIFEDLRALAPTVDLEAVLAARPELIVTGEAGGVDHGALDFWRDHPQVPAVAHGQLVTLDADEMERGSLRVLDGVEALCQAVEKARR